MNLVNQKAHYGPGNTRFHTHKDNLPVIIIKKLLYYLIKQCNEVYASSVGYLILCTESTPNVSKYF